MKIYKLKKFVLLLFVLLYVNTNQLLAQCSMCRTTIENNVSAGDTALGSGLNLGILYLFVAPYLIISILAFMWYKKSRENARKISFIRYPKS